MDENKSALQKEAPYLLKLQENLSQASFEKLKAKRMQLMNQLRELQVDYQAYVQTWLNLYSDSDN